MCDLFQEALSDWACVQPEPDAVPSADHLTGVPMLSICSVFRRP